MEKKQKTTQKRASSTTSDTEAEILLSEQTRALSSPESVRAILTYSLSVAYAQREAQRLGLAEEFKSVVGEANLRMSETGPEAVMEAVVSVIGPFTVPPEWQVGSGTAAPEEDDNV